MAINRYVMKNCLLNGFDLVNDDVVLKLHLVWLYYTRVEKNPCLTEVETKLLLEFGTSNVLDFNNGENFTKHLFDIVSKGYFNTYMFDNNFGPISVITNILPDFSVYSDILLRKETDVVMATYLYCLYILSRVPNENLSEEESKIVYGLRDEAKRYVDAFCLLNMNACITYYEDVIQDSTSGFQSRVDIFEMNTSNPDIEDLQDTVAVTFNERLYREASDKVTDNPLLHLYLSTMCTSSLELTHEDYDIISNVKGFAKKYERMIPLWNHCSYLNGKRSTMTNTDEYYAPCMDALSCYNYCKEDIVYFYNNYWHTTPDLDATSEDFSEVAGSLKELPEDTFKEMVALLPFSIFAAKLRNSKQFSKMIDSRCIMNALQLLAKYAEPCKSFADSIQRRSTILHSLRTVYFKEYELIRNSLDKWMLCKVI